MWWVLLSTTFFLHACLMLLVSYGFKKIGIPALFSLYDQKLCLQRWRYPFFEVISTLSYMPLIVHYASVTYLSLVWLLLVLMLLALAFIDVKCFILPDLLTFAVWAMGLLVNGYTQWFVDLPIAIVSSVGVYLSMQLFAHLYYRLRGQIGLGGGDIKLLSGFSAWFGWKGLLTILWMASCSGLLWATIGIYFNKSTYQARIPFGPCLVASAWYYLVFLTSQAFYVPISTLS